MYLSLKRDTDAFCFSLFMSLIGIHSFCETMYFSHFFRVWPSLPPKTYTIYFFLSKTAPKQFLLLIILCRLLILPSAMLNSQVVLCGFILTIFPPITKIFAELIAMVWLFFGNYVLIFKLNYAYLFKS